MPFIRNIRSDKDNVTLFNGQVTLGPGETVRISSDRLSSTEVQTEISAGNVREVPSLTYEDSTIKGDWDMAASTALPPGAEPGFIYTVISAAVHPSTNDSFEAGDLAIILADGSSARNITATAASSGGGTSDYTWITVTSQHTAVDKQYILADSSLGSFNILLPSSPTIGFITAVIPNNGSFETNPVTVLRNGNPLQGNTEDLLMDENLPVSLVYVGGTTGWMVLPFDDNAVVIKDIQADSFYTLKNVAGTSYTLIPSDSGKILIFDTPDPFTLNLPSNAVNPNQRGYYVSFRNKQGGAITLVPAGTDVVEGAGVTTNDSTKLNSVYLETTGANSVWVSAGDLS